MQKLLKNLLLTTSIVLVGGVFVSFGLTTQADNWFTDFFTTTNKVKGTYGDLKDVAKFGQEVTNDAKSTAKFFNVGQKVKDSSGAVGTVQADGTVKTDAGKVLGRVNVKTPTGGTGTPTTYTSEQLYDAATKGQTVEVGGSTWKHQLGTDNWKDPSGRVVQTDQLSSMSRGGSGSGITSGGTTNPTTTPTKPYTVDQLNGMGEESSIKIGNETLTKQMGSKGPEWVNSSGKTYTPEQLSLASQDTSSWTTVDGYYNPKTGDYWSVSQHDTYIAKSADSQEYFNGFKKVDYTDGKGNYYTAEQKANIDNAKAELDTSTKNEVVGTRKEGDLSKGDNAKAEAESAKEEASVWNHKAITKNVAQYALLILAAALADNDWSETKTVTVKANLLEQTQGESGDGSVGSVSTLDGTTTADAAASMATLLANNAVNYDPLLSKVVDLSGMTGGLTGTGGTGSVVTSGTQYKKIIKRRREQLFQVYSIASSMIAAGSNAISSRFYDRLLLYIDGLMSTSGTLGALSTINDSERFVMFEMSRGAALSATELGFRGSGTLRELDVLEEESHGS